jgi:hypothetical protein
MPITLDGTPNGYDSPAPSGAVDAASASPAESLVAEPPVVGPPPDYTGEAASEEADSPLAEAEAVEVSDEDEAAGELRLAEQELIELDMELHRLEREKKQAKKARDLAADRLADLREARRLDEDDRPLLKTASTLSDPAATDADPAGEAEAEDEEPPPPQPAKVLLVRDVEEIGAAAGETVEVAGWDEQQDPPQPKVAVPEHLIDDDGNRAITLLPDDWEPFDDPADAAQDTTWREVDLGSLSITPGVLKLLHEAGYRTVGQLADFTAKDQPLTKIPKIGPAKAEQIAEALDRFWARRGDR